MGDQRRRRAVWGWFALAYGVVVFFATADYLVDDVVLIAAVAFGPLLASIRLGRHGTAWVASVGVGLALTIAVIEPGMEDFEQRVSSGLIAVLASTLAVYLAHVREQRDRAALVLIYEADQAAREKQTTRALAGYRRTIQLFPKTYAAAVARQRLKEMPT